MTDNIFTGTMPALMTPCTADRKPDFDALVRHRTIDAKDLKLMHRTDSVDQAFDWVTAQLMKHALAKPGAMM